MKIAKYDLARYIVSFNFFEWLLAAQARGYTHVCFANTSRIKTDKWPVEMARERFNSILRVGCELAGMREFIGDVGDEIGNPCGALVVDTWRRYGFKRRLRSVYPPVKFQYTVTLRKTLRANGRDSDEDVWRAFAEEIGAYVIPDYDEKKIHLWDRMALYAGAEMNFFVSNGPAILCSFTEYPCMIFDTHRAAGSLNGDGIKGWGAQYPWMIANQFAIWEEANAENIRKHFYAWRDGKEYYTPTAITLANSAPAS